MKTQGGQMPSTEASALAGSGPVSRVNIGFVGAHGWSSPLLTSVLSKPGFQARVYDNSSRLLAGLAELGAITTDSPVVVAQRSQIVVCATSDIKELERHLFCSQTGILSALPKHSVALLSPSTHPSYYPYLLRRIAEEGRPDVSILDAACLARSSHGNHNGRNALVLSGPAAALSKANKVLHGIPECLWPVPGGLGQASKVEMLYQLLTGLHAAAAAEAMGLAAKAGQNTQVTFDIISNAAGTSSAFETRVPHMLSGDRKSPATWRSTLNSLRSAISTARKLHFPLPLTATVEQLFISGLSQGFGDDGDSALVHTYLPERPDLVKERACQTSMDASHTWTGRAGIDICKIGFVGLGAMGQGMAASLVRAGYLVQGHDVSCPAVEAFTSTGPNAIAASSPEEAISGSDVVLLMVQNASQIDEVLFGDSHRGAAALSSGSVVVVNSTVPPEYVRSVSSRLTEMGKGVLLVDAPVSGGVARAANGTLTIICSGENEGLSKVRHVLLAMAGEEQNLCLVRGGIGMASSVKLVNQLLAGVHIAAAAEAMAFAARLDLDTQLVFDILKTSSAWSWMLENRVPQMLNGDWTPHSALAIFVKDLGIVLDEAARLNYYAPISSAAHTLYLAGAGHGWTNESDSGVVRLWEMLGSSVRSKANEKFDNDPQDQGANSAANGGSAEDEINVPFVINPGSDNCKGIKSLVAATTLRSLPPEYPHDVLSSIQGVVNSGQVPTLVILDDDPTGTQTCHDIDVLTVWDSATLDSEFRLSPRGFFILTNSRALPSAEARKLVQEICENVSQAAKRASKAFEIVLRGDSTLRGHLPEEPEAAEAALGAFDGWVIAPFFAQGGRYTISDVQYVREGDALVPASQTQFAVDATFGYRNSNLRQYVLEKCGPRFDDDSFISITLEDIREGGPKVVTEKLLSVGPDLNRVIIVNAVAESDMHVFVAGLLEAEKNGRRYLYRTGASFVSSRLGIKGIPPLTMKDLGIVLVPGERQSGGLVVAGSHVPKSTAQLEALTQRLKAKLQVVEVRVPDLIASGDAAEKIVRAAAQAVSVKLYAGYDVVVMTSRTLVKGPDALSSLNIASQVAMALVQLMELIDVHPRYIIAKGGITSSETATKGLKMKRARVLGQAAPGVPLWRCDEQTSRHRGVPFVVFPGNVGTKDTLADLVEAWAIPDGAF
ncbi:ketose-bisphosphate aldolase class-II family protein [Metarhizium album ARSEF 1941]|uniref:Ketose-bisphosphate aldolase class-II family protein n=1 Tax=Metarhizium album (strain ARSEF 1941) TaxID=1081103 RepID=A0A0B2WJX7_METAS|nr:ketose-bisphosphate aldolase class-II family protein [Metarhizium album ARSEF 1941]KHN94233.1 ketose-bisphosphate aldolase class-II family protein [Metarhizium album ARSEF 1941]